MQMLTANEAKTQFGKTLMQVQREPVQISKNGTPVAVMMSHEDFEQIEKLKLDYLHQCALAAIDDAKCRQLQDGKAYIQSLKSKLSGKVLG